MEVVRLSALRTGRLYPPPSRKYSRYYCGRKDYVNSNDNIGNRTRDLSPGSTVLQPAASPRAPISTQYKYKMFMFPCFAAPCQPGGSYNITSRKRMRYVILTKYRCFTKQPCTVQGIKRISAIYNSPQHTAPPQ